jgi:hypothetical protein
MTYEVVISLVLLGLFAIATFTYISSHANGAKYFSKFYANDIATAAEVVNAGYGDVLLRYDNLKPGLKLAFTLSNGKVSVGEPAAIEATTYYGQAKRFDGDGTIINPTYLVLRKAGGFSITDAEKVLKTCGTAQRKIPLEEAVVYVNAQKDIKDAFAKSLQGTSITITEEQSKATLQFTIEKRSGQKNVLAFSPTSDDGKIFTCNFVQQLGALSTIDFATSEPVVTAGPFAVGITITVGTDATLSGEQIGEALAHALAVYYR